MCRVEEGGGEECGVKGSGGRGGNFGVVSWD